MRSPGTGPSGHGPGCQPGDRVAERPALGPDRHLGVGARDQVGGGVTPTGPKDGYREGTVRMVATEATGTDREEGPEAHGARRRRAWPEAPGSDGIPSAEQTGDGRFRWQTGLPPQVG